MPVLLTKNQEDRVKEIRKVYKGRKVRVQTKGQKSGWICVTVHSDGKLFRFWYDKEAKLCQQFQEEPLFDVDKPESGSALTDI